MTDPLRVHLKDGYTVEVVKRQVHRFEEETGIEVHLDVRDEAAAHDAFVASAQSLDGPDITTVSFWYLPEYVSAGYLRPLVLSSMELRSDMFHPEAIDALCVDGEVYAVPHTLLGSMLSCNRRLLDAAGVDAPGSAAGIVDAAARIARATDAAGLVARGAPDFSSFSTYAGWAAGYDVRLLTDGVAPDRIVDALVPLVEALGGSGPADVSDMTYIDAGRSFVDGGSAMLFDSSGWGNTFEDPSESPIAGMVDHVVPHGPAAPFQFFYTEGLAITAWSRRQEDAERFIRWRHEPPTVLAEAKTLRVDLPRVDLGESEAFADIVESRDLGVYRSGVERAWATVDRSYFPTSPTFVEESRAFMGPISQALARPAEAERLILDAINDAERVRRR